MLKVAGAVVMLLGVGLLLLGLADFNGAPVFVSDSLFTPGRYYIGRTRLQVELVFGAMCVWWGWILFTREKRLRK
jgi:hypothetical protein